MGGHSAVAINPAPTAVCGQYQYSGVGPSAILYPCDPVNATFDDISTGPISGSYVFSTWKGFTVVAPDSSSEVTPFSEPHYARLAAGTTGTIVPNFDATGSFISAGLYAMYYACADPATGAPTACDIVVSGDCEAGLAGNYKANSTTLSFTPEGTSMQAVQGVLAQWAVDNGSTIQGGGCLNFTIRATTAVDVLLDSLIFAMVDYDSQF